MPLLHHAHCIGGDFAGGPPSSIARYHYVSATGNSILVNAGGDLQAAIDSAGPGDEIVLAAGARFIGNYTLRAKTQPGTVIIRSSHLTSLPEGTRVGPQARIAGDRLKP